jgi:hypothetical protein
MTKATDLKPTGPRLSDVQLLLLSSAINRSDGSLLPPPATLGWLLDERCRKAISGLLRRSFAAEQPTDDLAAVWREDGDAKMGAFITATGRAIVGAPETEQLSGAGQNIVSTPAPIDHPRPGSKIASVIAMLRRTEGTSLDELVLATSWLPHTTRAALTGLRKKGHVIDKRSVENTTRYFIGMSTQGAEA